MIPDDYGEVEMLGMLSTEKILSMMLTLHLEK